MPALGGLGMENLLRSEQDQLGSAAARLTLGSELICLLSISL